MVSKIRGPPELRCLIFDTTRHTLRGILHDENYFPDPSTFNPDRFLKMDQPDHDNTRMGDAHNNATPSPIDPWDVGCGYGRRICQGIPVAKTELWIVMAMTIACFEIRPEVDPRTKEPVVPKASWTGECLRFVFYRVPLIAVRG